MFGGGDLGGYLLDGGGGSGDAFVDALDECFDSDRDRDGDAAAGGSVLRATGLYEDDGEEGGGDAVELSASIREDGVVDGSGAAAVSLESFLLIRDELREDGEEGGGGRRDDLASIGSIEDRDEDREEGTDVNRGAAAENFTLIGELRIDETKLDDKVDGILAEEVELKEIDSKQSDTIVDHGDTNSVGKDVDSETEVCISCWGLGDRHRRQDQELATTIVAEKKKCVMRLGSREAEDLLKLDVEEIVRPLRLSSDRSSVDWSRELGPDELSRYVEALDVRETYMDTVWDMEEILLDTGESSGNHSFWATKVDHGLTSPLTRPRWTGSSTSVYDGLWKVDSVEVTGARQRRGGASLGERVVGVREHTIYRIQVKSGENQWEIERRYREFVDLFQQLKRMFDRARVRLPSPWEKVSIESRKVFGNTSPDVVEFRSALLQVCLQSSLQAGVPISTAAPLLRFLFPDPGETRLPMLAAAALLSPELVSRDQNFMQLKELGLGVGSPRPRSGPGSSPDRQDSSFGRTIRLVLQIHTSKPLNQQLSNQRNLCAGCFEQLDSGNDLVAGLAKALGLRKPRFCEYTGQIYCVRCHLNETAILPARVLHYWDFTPRVVSQLAKAYLDSIYDQPMLCVSAVNPFLYSRVSILAHVSEMRRKLSRLIKCIRCPSRSRIQQLLGSRRYLLEQNDFYALRDLTDLSKGAFAVLPGLLRATMEKLTIHITRKCSVCVELGEQCGAGVVCDSPRELIYPFEDANVHRCQLCNASYHLSCFSSIETCRICTRDHSPMRQQMNNDEQQQQISSSPTASSSSTSTWIEESFKSDQSPSQQPKRKLFSGLFSSSSSSSSTDADRKLQASRNSAIVKMSAILGGPVEL